MILGKQAQYLWFMKVMIWMDMILGWVMGSDKDQKDPSQK